MTPHEQNIAIARLLPELLIVFKDSIYWTNTVQDVTDREWLYVIHEAEKVLTDAQWITYIALLHDDVVIYPTRRAVTATYPQRREALLRTLNL